MTLIRDPAHGALVDDGFTRGWTWLECGLINRTEIIDPWQNSAMNQASVNAGAIRAGRASSALRLEPG